MGKLSWMCVSGCGKGQNISIVSVVVGAAVNGGSCLWVERVGIWPKL